MRPIKFNAWDNNLKSWIEEGQGFHVIGECTMFGMIEHYCHANPAGASSSIARLGDIIVMQYTGLNDKDGNELYEFDVVEFYHKGQMQKCMIIWDERNAMFALKWPDGYVNPYPLNIEKYKKLGNSFSEPDLIKHFKK